jgi:DNA-binding MarR family transcriptional regulator
MDDQTSPLVTSLYMLVLGLGLGMVMQVLVIAVQNAVAYEDLGAATSGATFFRSIGSAFGVAVFGAIFANLLSVNLQGAFPAGALPPGLDAGSLQANPAALQQLPPAVHAALVHAYAVSLQPVFLAAVPFAAVAFALSWLLPEVPLRQTTQATDPGQTFGMPEDRSSLDELTRALSVLTSRESRRRMYARLAARAGVQLAPGSCWMLLRLDEQAPTTLASLARRAQVAPAALAPYLQELRQDGLVVVVGAADDADTAQIAPTPEGRQVLDRLIAARREALARLLSDWSPERHAEVAEMLSRLARALATDETAPRPVPT